MLGGEKVGKSSLVSQFMTSEYLHAYDTSIGESHRLFTSINNRYEYLTEFAKLILFLGHLFLCQSLKLFFTRSLDTNKKSACACSLDSVADFQNTKMGMN